MTASPTLGVLQLANTPMMLVGCLGNPATFDFPIRARQVPGAWVSNVVAGDPGVTAAFVAAAREMEAAGCAAVTTTCGFAIRLQQAIAGSVGVPVSTSSLLLLPYLLRMMPPAARIAVMTYDATHFSPELLPLAGVADPDRITIAGIEGSESWERMGRPVVEMTQEILERDVLAAVDRVLAASEGIGAILFECAGFGSVSEAVRRRTRLPVHDAVTNARMLMAGVG